MTTERDEAVSPTGQSTSAPPFVRRQAQWGRMPSAVFHAGPLPKAPSASPFAVPPQSAQPVAGPRSGSAILTGSMIPRTPSVRPPETREAVVEVGEPEWVDEAPVLIAARPVVDAAVRPLPPVSAPAPEAVSALATAADTPEPVITVGPSERVAVPPLAQARRRSRTSLYVGATVAVLAVVAGATWLATRPQAPETPQAAEIAAGPAPATVSPTAVSDVPVPEVVEPLPIDPVPATPGPDNPPATAGRLSRPAVAVAATRPVEVPSRAPSSERPASPTVPLPIAPTITPQPLIAAPPAAPTAARSMPDDADAPIATRPQPLD